MTDLQAPYGALAYFLDLHPAIGDFRADVIEGLGKAQKSISPKYFYDEYGSKIFDKITELEEYYPTRTEKKLFDENASAITGEIKAGASIFEYGSGSSEKIEWLIDGVDDVPGLVAMDISRDHLIESASDLAKRINAPVAAICADFHQPVPPPPDVIPGTEHFLGYFPGSTIGNMTLEAAQNFLRLASATLGENAQFLLGADLIKDTAILEAAYNDKDGVTAAFNMNLLRRMKRELDADIDIDAFEHHAFFNDDEARIEMHLRAKHDTIVTVDDRPFSFAAGETLHTENSHKFTLNRLQKLIEPTPWRMVNAWTDEKNWYAACLLSNK